VADCRLSGSLANSALGAEAAVLWDVLKTKRTLTSLDLEGNEISFFTKRAIDSKIRVNSRQADYNSQLLGDSVQPTQLKVNWQISPTPSG
jgi:hypothetical protein